MAEQSTPPTIVLVHGAFAESAGWDGVIRGLHAAGFRAVAVANPLRGVRRDAEALQAVVTGLPGDLVLVAHSYGGMLITDVDDARIRSRLYIGAFAPEQGESAGDLAGRFPGSTLADTLERFPLPGGDVGGSHTVAIPEAPAAVELIREAAAVAA